MSGNVQVSNSPGAWLSRQRVTLPEPIEGYVDRPSLVARCDPAKRRLTAISAPAGFGKTTLLAEACRRARQRGHLVAWLSLAEHDDPSTLMRYIVFSCIEAGLDIGDDLVDEGNNQIDHRMALLLRRIEEHGASCVLALDDVRELGIQKSVDLLDRIVHIAPPNLCLAMAYREQPSGLGVAPWILQDQGIVLTFEDLQFTKPEVARFFEMRLSREELATVAESSLGWPVALRIERIRSQGAMTAAALEALAANWIEATLLRRLPSADRNLVECAGVFREVDVEVLESVLGPGSVERLKEMPALRGLAGYSDTAKPVVLAFHPLIHEYCVGTWARKHPERFCELQVSAAHEFIRRGNVVEAVRHAIEGEDPTLAAKTLEDAGAIRLIFRYGVHRTQQAIDSFSEDILKRFPRLVLARCGLLIFSGELAKADRVYAQIEGMRHDRKGGSDPAIEVDNLIFKGLRALVGCRSIGDPDMRAVRESCRGLLNQLSIDDSTRAVLKFGLSLFDCQVGHFESCIDWARQTMEDDNRYIWMYAGLQFGTTAFAQGLGQDARIAYVSMGRAAKGSVLHDTKPDVVNAALAAEVELEMDGTVPRRDQCAPFGQLAKLGAWLDVYVATADTTAELTLRQNGPVAALDELERALEFARRTNRPALRQCLGALCVEMLALAGRLDRVDPIWAEERLPSAVGDCLDRETFGWRERECICRARLQVLLVQRDFVAGEALAEAFVDATRADGLRRSLSWALALSMALAHAAGNSLEARERLIECVRLYAETGYVRALIRQQGTGLPLLEELDEAALAPALRQARISLLRVMRDSENSVHSLSPTTSVEITRSLTQSELDIVGRLDKERDTEIASTLGISESGVRFHVRNIFTKLGVNDRLSAAHRAREHGFIPSAPQV